MRRHILAVSIALVLTCAAPAQRSALPRSAARVWRLRGISQVDQAIERPNGQILVRDSDFGHPEQQGIYLFGRNGQLVRRIGSFGSGPGSYSRLMQIAVDRSGRIWAADFEHRVTIYDASGQVVATHLFLRPSFYIKGMALDPNKEQLILAGCEPLHFYLDLGCLLVHTYSLKDLRWKGSYVKTDPTEVTRHLEPFQVLSLAVGPTGTTYMVDGPGLELWRLDPTSAVPKVTKIRSEILKPMRAFDPHDSPAQQDSIYRSSYLTDRVIVVGGKVVVSVREPGGKHFLLYTFNAAGRQVSGGAPSPGYFVGSSGRLGLFASPAPDGVEIRELPIP